MKKQLLLAISLIAIAISVLQAQGVNDDTQLKPYIDALKTEGKNPFEFVLKKFDIYDLLIFDDALHTAVEPFDFYQELIKKPAFHNKVKNIFVEVIPISKQAAVDDYLRTVPENVELLYPAFQNDLNAEGWPYKTYFDLLHTIYTVNQTLPDDEKLNVIGVASPTYWYEIKNSRELKQFRKSLRAFDYMMYITIADQMENFNSDKKAIFLTNTRHAYKGIKTSSGNYYWNVGTFLNQWHPGKTYSVHFHSLYLFIDRNYQMKFDRIADGIWDYAFKTNGNVPIAIPLKNNAFGNESYIGNLMLNVAPGQTMYDAYDALIFLAPVETLHKTAMVDFIYTDDFKKELQRRAGYLYTEDEISAMLSKYGSKNIAELIDAFTVYQAKVLMPQAQSISPIDAWKNK